MKALLISPPFIDPIVANMSDFFDKSSGHYPPVGLMYLASYLRKHSKHEVEILDANLRGMDYASIVDHVCQRTPDVVGITVLTFNLPTVRRLVTAVRAALPSAHIVLGGPHPSIYPDETLAFPEVDYVVIAEGELVFLQLLDALQAGSAPLNIQGIGYKEGARLCVSRETTFIEDLDALPFPAVDLVDYARYSTVLSSQRRSTVMMSSRGCPFNCIYCDRPHLGRRFRARSPGNVVDEIEMYVRDYGITDIKLFDDTFTVDRRRVLGICAEIQRRGLTITWGIRARVNTVDIELLRSMRQAGLVSVSFGIEAGTQPILNNLQKGITLEQVVQATGACRQLGIEVLGDFILGNPGETKEQLLETIRFACRLPLDYAQFTIMTPYPSTQLYKNGLASGVIPSDYWKAFAADPTPAFVTPVWEEHFTKDELIALLRQAYRAFYFRPSYMFRRLRRLRSFGELLRKAGVLMDLILLNLIPSRRLARNFKQQALTGGENPAER